MELLAVIIGLAALRFEGSNVTIYSDSKYVVDAVEKGWVFGWEKTGFKKKRTQISGDNSSPFIANTA